MLCKPGNGRGAEMRQSAVASGNLVRNLQKLLARAHVLSSAPELGDLGAEGQYGGPASNEESRTSKLGFRNLVYGMGAF